MVLTRLVWHNKTIFGINSWTTSGSVWQLINEKPDSLARVTFFYSNSTTFLQYLSKAACVVVLHIGDCVALAAWASNFFIGPKKERVGCTPIFIH